MGLNAPRSLEPQTYHALGYMQHSFISAEVANLIHPEKNYRIVETRPDGTIFSDTKVEGSMIVKHYGTIFSDYKHGFVVYEDGGDTPIFVYSGLIPDRVFQVISQLQH